MPRAQSIPSRPRKVSPPRLSEAQSADEDDFKPGRRKTGIRVVGDMPWGAHLCVFYETKQDLLDVAVSFFEAGLKAHEFCLWAVSEPVTEDDAKASLRAGIPGFDRYLEAGHIEILDGYEWYLKGGAFDLLKILGGWDEKLRAALAKGYDGMRISGDGFWLGTGHWRDFRDYEQELNLFLARRKMIAMCTYSLGASRAIDVLDVVHAHQFSIARRNGQWEFLVSKPFPGHRSLTPRERAILAHIVMGASNKEAGRMLSISPRTVEFHRANIMQKLDARNTVDLVRKVLGG